MKYIVDEENVEIVYSFIEESTEFLEGLEKEVLKLEGNGTDKNLINDIFRRVHSIKGLSSFLSFVCITKLSHQIEFALDNLRKGVINVNSDLIDILLEGIDLLEKFISTIRTYLSEYREKDLVVFIENEDIIDSIIERVNKLIEERNDDKRHEVIKQDNKNDEEDEYSILKSEEFRKNLSADFTEQFILETNDHIEIIENLLSAIDEKDYNLDSINDLFRSIHSIKGSTGIIISTIDNKEKSHRLVKEVSIVTHNFETLLDHYRSGDNKFNKDLINLSYNVVDYLKESIEFLSSNGDGIISNKDLIDSIINEIDKVKETRSLKRQEEKKESVQKSKSSNILSQSIRVNQEKLDKMMNTIAELITTKNSFMHIAKRLSIEYNLPELSKDMKEVGFSINRISDELQNDIMSVRMIEIKTIFQKMPRIVRDISNNTNKKIDLLIEGEETEIDKSIIEMLSDPLIHLIRNAADHGIETPEKRIDSGKDETGKIILRAHNRNKYVFIEIEDDGKGIDYREIKNKAIDKEFITEDEAEKLSKSQILNLIFLPGFSTAKKVTEVSGRGVGMDIVKSNINKVKGIVNIDSEAGKGTKMVIQLPLTLAVSRGLLVEVEEESYIFPIEYISETVKLRKSDLHEMNCRYFTELRGEVISVEWFSRIFMIESMNKNDEGFYNSVIITDGIKKMAVIVDKLKSEQEFVVKTLSEYLMNIKGISGSTLLGNGKVVLIINPVEMIYMAEKLKIKENKYEIINC